MQELQPSSPVTQRDIAKALGIGLATVSMALRGDPRISSRRRAQIQATARKMGYRPNPNAAALSHLRGASETKPTRAALAWLNLWPHPEDLRRFGEFDQYWHGAELAARKFGYRLEEFACADSAQLPRLQDILLARGINGILIPPSGGPPMDWGSFEWDRFSVVRLSRSVEQPAAHIVAAHQAADAEMAFNAIRARGYPRVGLVTVAIPHHRFDAGFLKAQRFVVESQRLPVFDIRGYSPWADLPKLERWLKREKPDAILTDLSCMAEMLNAAGLHVPKDIGLAVTSILDGNADTGIDQNPREVGRVAVLTLISLIHDNDRGIPANHREILIRGRWVDGPSLPTRKAN